MSDPTSFANTGALVPAKMFWPTGAGAIIIATVMMDFFTLP
jgi:hypothetical protein